MRFLSYLVTLLVAVLLASCGGGGGSAGTNPNGAATFFSTAPAALTLTLGNAQSFALGGGTGPYSAVSSDASVAVAGVSGSTVTLGAVKPGSATVTLTDSKGTALVTAVTVQPSIALFTRIPFGLTLPIGSAGAQTYAVGGGVPPYTVFNNNPGVVSAVLNASGNSITLTGLAAGAALVGITDSTGHAIAENITVTATSGAPLFTTAPGAVTLGTKSNTTYSIGGGSAPYVVTSSNESVATVTLSGSSYTIHGVAVGTANIVIRDTAGTLVTVAVTVGNTQLTLNPAKANTFIGITNYAYIIGGVGPFTALSGFPSVATVSIGTLSTTTGVFTPDSNGNVLKMVANQAVDPDQVVVTDSVGNSASFALTATAGTLTESLMPNALTISACYSGDVTLLLYGSSGTVNVFSSDSTVFTAAVTSSSSSPVVVTATKILVDPTLTGTTTITAIDSVGASATSVITVVPAATTCP